VAPGGMSLLALQRDMSAWLIRADADAARRIGAPPGLAIYQNNYRAQLVACLDDAFERVRDWIGGEAFRAGIVAHVDRVPPSSWTLDAYARDFPATLAMLYPDDAEIAELAWVDMALGEAFVAPDAVALRADDLAEIDWDRASFTISPTLDLGSLTTNATAIWSALAAGEIPPAVETLAEAAAILVWRDGETARFRAIDRAEQQALLAIRAGQTFAALCADMVEAHGEQAGVARAGRMLGQWLGDGLIVGVS
jgi:hypothetical protein